MSHSDTVPMLTCLVEETAWRTFSTCRACTLAGTYEPGVARSGDAARKVRAPQYMHERYGRITVRASDYTPNGNWEPMRLGLLH